MCSFAALVRMSGVPSALSGTCDGMLSVWSVKASAQPIRAEIRHTYARLSILLEYALANTDNRKECKRAADGKILDDGLLVRHATLMQFHK